jgi:hypothetical protein
MEDSRALKSPKQKLCYEVSSPPQQLLCMSIHRLFEKTETASQIAAISPKIRMILDLKVRKKGKSMASRI